MYQRSDHAFGAAGGGTAALSLDQAIAPGFGRKSTKPTPPRRLEKFRSIVAEIDFVPDLGARIGSRQWFRGLATCIVLVSSAWALSPGYRPLIGIEPKPMNEAEWQEARAQTIAPLAFGADTGKRMAATDLVAPLADTPERPSLELVATMGRGDSFARVLSRAGIAEAEATKVAAMVSRAVALGEIVPGTRMDIVLGRRPDRTVARPLEMLAFRAKFDLRLQIERVNGALTLTRIPIRVDHTPLRIQGRRGSDLVSSARAAGVPGAAIQAYIKAIASQVPIGTLKPDDRFDIIIEHARAETGETRTGKLLFAGLDQGRRKIRMIEWSNGGRSEWFEAAGVGQQRGVMARPVSGRMTSGFGMRRHPLLGYSRLHKGVDFGVPHGAPIMAATDGVVSFAGRNGGYGNHVRLKHAGGLATSYSHMSRIAVRSGTRVRQGQVIGYVGSTGLSTGPHLHYEVYRNGQAINPKSISFVEKAQLSGGELARFRARLNQLTGVPVGSSRTQNASNGGGAPTTAR